MSGSLLEALHSEMRLERFGDWRPEPMPDLSGVKDLYLDFETNGLKWWAGHRPGGVAWMTEDGRRGYIPWAHRAGFNYDEETVKRWFHREVRDKNIYNANTRFEVHMAREWGVDFEAQNNRVSDCQHWAALLDDHRRKFSQEVLMQDYLTDGEAKVLTVAGETLDGSRMLEYPSGMVAVRATADVRGVWKLRKVMWPMLTEQGLQAVRELEDDCIYAVCEMERNSAPINVEMLLRWQRDAEQEFLRLQWEIHRDTGVKFTPTNASWSALFQALGLPITEFTPSTRDREDEDEREGSFTDAYIKHIDHPTVQKARRATKLRGILTRYFNKYADTIGPDGLLRFALHQLRGDDGGTISGRFSSSAIKIDKEKIGANIQQVMACGKQRIAWGYDEEDSSHDDEIFLIRKLFIPGAGEYIAADAKQIEYRLFAHYAENPKVLEAYRKNPDMSFHKFIWALFKQHKEDLSYKQQKNINFMKIYGGGLVKLAIMLEYITQAQGDMLRAEYAPKAPPRDHPLLRPAAEVMKIYDRELPEVKPLIDMASDLAANRGYVKDILGRRTRFPHKQRLHKALNGVIQGSAATVMKRKMVEVHRERKRIGFVPRLSVHDEIAGDALGGAETERQLKAILDRQSFPMLKVPILWDVKRGATWADCK